MSSILLNLDSSTMPAGTRTDDFRVTFSQPIQLPGEGGWEIALLSAKLWYSWYNISTENGNNLMRYSTDGGATWKPVLFPDGQYEITAIDDYLHSVMKSNGDFFIDGGGNDAFNINITPNYATIRTDVEIVSLSNYQLDLASSLIYLLLGFGPVIVTATAEGSDIANINNDVNAVNIICDIVTGAYTNGTAGNVLWSFVPKTAPGTNIDIDIVNPVYIPLASIRVQSIGMRIVDNLGRRLNLNGQPVSYLLAIRKGIDNTITNELLRAIADNTRTNK